MAENPKARKIPLVFFRTRAAREPVRDWLRQLPEVERHCIGQDLLRAQWRWPIGMPLCRPMGGGLWEVRTSLPTNRISRVFICLHGNHLVALHGFIKKTQATPPDELAIARKRQKELEK
jgi:phage-related protein